MNRLVLSIDGGGIRGIIPAMLMKYIEKIRKHRLAIDFDMFSGTSTGGILACGAFSEVPAEELVRLYVNDGPAIFQHSLWRKFRTGFGAWGPKYNASALEFSVERVLGDKTLSWQYHNSELIVPTYCVRLPRPEDTDHDGVAEQASAVFFKSWDARERSDRDFRLRDVCRATSAAPTYFSAASIPNVKGDPYLCVDGGTYANNPALCAWADAKDLYPKDKITVISLGTGSKVKPIPGSGDWGALGWLPHISNIFMDGAADSVSYIANHIQGDQFIRCEMALEGVNDAMDCATPENIQALQRFGHRYVDQFANPVLKAIRGAKS